MKKYKIITVLFLGIFTLLFVGILNKSYEFYEPQLCLKYPTFKIFFNKPEVSEEGLDSNVSETKNSQLQEYESVYELNENLGNTGEISAYVLVQLFLTALFAQWIKFYKCRFFTIDIILFFISVIVLFIAFATSIYHSQFWIAGILILAFNFLVTGVWRSYLLKRK